MYAQKYCGFPLLEVVTLCFASLALWSSLEERFQEKRDFKVSLTINFQYRGDAFPRELFPIQGSKAMPTVHVEGDTQFSAVSNFS